MCHELASMRYLGEPGAARKEGGNVFSVGPAAEYDHRPAIVFADPVGEGEGDRSSSVIPVLQQRSDYNSRSLLGGNPADWD
jgi:hypothetical protein